MILEFPRPKLRVSTTFRDFMVHRYGCHYPALLHEWLSGSGYAYGLGA